MSDLQGPADRNLPKKRIFNARGFVSLLLLLQCVVMIVSGVVRYFSPRGREAHWVDWRVLGLDKDMWSSMHMVSALAFVILSVVHLAYNWRPMVNYICRKSLAIRSRGRELTASVVLTAVLLGLTITDAAPGNLLFVESEKLKDDYAASIQRAPWPHAEEAAIETVCKRFGIPIKQALRTLENSGVPARDSSETLSEVARRHGTSPAGVFNHLRRTAGSASQPAWTDMHNRQKCRRKQ